MVILLDKSVGTAKGFLHEGLEKGDQFFLKKDTLASGYFESQVESRKTGKLRPMKSIMSPIQTIIGSNVCYIEMKEGNKSFKFFSPVFADMICF